MSWEVKVYIDQDQTDIGLVNATWTDPNEALGVFTYSERAQANVAGGTVFVNHAIAARNAWQTKQQGNIDKEVWVANKLIELDPQV